MVYGSYPIEAAVTRLHNLVDRASAANLVDDPPVILHRIVDELRQNYQSLTVDYQRLEAEHERYHTLFAAVPAAYLLTDLAGIIQAASDAALAQLNIAYGDLIGSALPSYIAPSDQAELRQHLMQLEAGAAHLQWTACLLLRDGRSVPVAIQVCRIWDAVRQQAALGWLLSESGQQRPVEQELQQREWFRQSVLDALPEHIAVLDMQGTIVAANQAWLDFAEANSPARQGIAEGANYLQVCDCASGPQANEARQFAAGMRAVLRGEQRHFSMEYACHTPDRPYWFVGHITCCAGEQSNYLVVSHEDITERKQAEEALQENRALLQGILEHIPAAISVKDMQGRYILFNQYCVSWLRFDPERVIGRADSDFFPPQIAAVWTSTEQEISQTGQPAEHEIVIATDDQPATYLTRQFPIYDRQGKLYGTGGIATDITAYKQAEQALRLAHDELEQRIHERTAEVAEINRMLKAEIAKQRTADQELQQAYRQKAELNQQVSRSRDLLRALFDGLEDGLLLLDGAGRVLVINHALAALLNIAPDQLVNRSWGEICKSMGMAFSAVVVQHTLHSGKAHYRRERLIHPNGRVQILDMQTFSLLDTNQQVEQVILHVVDVTERLQLEALMMQHEQFVASGKLAAMVTHEINSPLQTIQNLLYLIEMGTEEQRKRYLALISEEIDRISTLMQQLLDIYRPDSIETTCVDVTLLLERILMLMSGSLHKYKIEVTPRLSPRLPVIQGRLDQLTQVLMNLINNAIDAMPQGGTLSLHTDVQPVPDTAVPESEHIVVIEIRDSGMGISPEVQQHIFTPFFTTKQQGTGLGLAISQKIIEQHNGTISFKSAPGSGSTFTITLPLNRRETMALVEAPKE